MSQQSWISQADKPRSSTDVREFDGLAELALDPPVSASDHDKPDTDPKPKPGSGRRAA